MQKTVRINLLARNSAAKHFQKIKHRDTKNEWTQWHQATNRIKATEGKYVREERLHRRQDWIAGPLAPNRNAGTDKGVYGTADTDFFQLANIPKSVSGMPKKEGYAALSEKDEAEGFKGDTIVGNVVVNDRVVIVAGPERLRGLIGYVSDADPDKEIVKLNNINTADIRIPSYAQPPKNKNDPNPARYTSLDLPIPMSHVRLVSEVLDDQGRKRDVILRHVHAGPPYQQRYKGSHLPSHTRYLTGAPGDEPVEIPWPEDIVATDFVYHEGDSTRTAVITNSWTPSMIYSPLGYTTDIPEVIDFKDNSYTRSQELFKIDVNGPGGLSNTQRAGLDGFIDSNKLIARQDRIAAGIMNEFRTKSKELNTIHDDVNWVKRKMIEDARAIWYQERKLVSPMSQAAELAVQQRAQARQAKIEEEKEKIRELRKVVQKLQVAEIEKGRVAVVGEDNRHNLDDLKRLPLSIARNVLRGTGFVPDRKFRKKLRREVEKLKEV